MKSVRSLFPLLSKISGPPLLRGLILAGMLVLSILGSRLDFIVQLDNRLIAERLDWAPRSASGKIAFIAIDKQTLDEVGVWPWPRSVYGRLLDRLGAANVGDIFLDIDFSTPSVPAEDRQLASALARAGGGVLLPVFRQQAAAMSAETEITKPIAEFLEAAWPVFANVATDSDGVLRHFKLGSELDGAPAASAASALGGGSETSGSLLVDFSIRPETVPTYSLADVLNGRVDGALLAGRTVVVGASAAELKDIFSVPIYGSLPGPLIHVLSAETLLQQRILHHVDAVPLNLFLAALMIASVLCLRSIGMVAVTGTLAFLALAFEGTAFFVQRDFSVVAGTAVPYLLLAMAWVLALNERIDVVQMVAAIANIDARNTRRLMRRIVSDSSDGIVAFGRDLKIAEISASAKSVLATNIGADLLESANAPVARRVGDLVEKYKSEPGKIHSGVVEFTAGGREEQRIYEASITVSPLEGPDGPSGPAFGGCIIIRDVTARTSYEERLKRLSEEDELTGLFNRREFLARLEGQDGLVIVLDVERFSNICATLGRDAGDVLLKAVGLRLARHFPGNLLARIGGDLFAIFVSDERPENAAGYAQRFLRLFEEPLTFNEMSANLAVRLGFAHTELLSAEGALRAAESALDIAKKAPDRWSMYDPAIALQQARSRRLEAEMPEALKDRDFFLLFQPQVDLAKGQFVGAEALLRWHHPHLGPISPAEFVPIAESSGLICEIGRWVLMQSCAEACRWPSGIVSVNVSPVQFEHTDIAEDIRQALSSSGLPPSRLCIELTESTFIADGGRSINTMAAIRSTGVTVALDDFGTGYSSMSYLADLPLDKLKIDQSFVRRMMGDPGVREIVKAIVVMAHGLGLEIVAEGIEGEIEKEALRALRCEIGQGYLFGKPQLSDEMLARYSLSQNANVA